MADLQRALVHLITASLAAPPNTTNLWCLLFNPDHLTGSYLPGFMVSRMFYCKLSSVELKPNYLFCCSTTLQLGLMNSFTVTGWSYLARDSTRVWTPYNMSRVARTLYTLSILSCGLTSPRSLFPSSRSPAVRRGCRGNCFQVVTQ